MPKMADTNIHKRLSLPYWLYAKGREFLHRPDLYAPSVATSLFHDAVEAFLYFLAEEKKIKNSNFLFMELVEKIGKDCQSVNKCYAMLRRLNRARREFKHRGISVTRGDASDFSSGVHEFFRDVSREELEVDFDAISIIHLVEHRRTRNQLHHAKNELENGDYEKSVEYSAKAFAVIMQYKRFNDRFPYQKVTFYEATHNIFSQKPPPDIEKLGQLLNSEFQQLRTYMEVIGSGIELQSYHKFQCFSPLFSVMSNNSLYEDYSRKERKYLPLPINLSAHHAQFCIDFVVNAAIQIRQSIPCVFSDSGTPESVVRSALRSKNLIVSGTVHRDSPILTWPQKETGEEIRMACSEETLDTVRGLNLPGHNVAGFIPVLQDDEIGFIERDAITLAR